MSAKISGTDGLILEAGNKILFPDLSEQKTAAYTGNRNKIINPFTENQRGSTSVADDTYCLDRWYVLTESGNVTIAQIDDPESGAPKAIRLTQPDASAKRMGLATIIESKNIKAFRSAAMNLYMRVKPSFSGNVRYAIIEHTGTADVVTSDVVNNWSSATFTPGNFFIAGLNIIKTGTVAPGAATYGEFSDYGTFGASLNNAILFVWTESAQAQNATLELNRPQFELGIVRTPQEWRDNELSLCRRYAYQMTTPPLQGIASSDGLGGNRMSMAHPEQMRAIPALTMIGNLPVFDGTATVTLASTGTNYSTTSTVEFDGLLSAAVTALRPLKVFQSGSAALLVSAEL